MYFSPQRKPMPKTKLCKVCRMESSEHDREIFGVKSGCRGFHFGLNRTRPNTKKNRKVKKKNAKD